MSGQNLVLPAGHRQRSQEPAGADGRQSGFVSKGALQEGGSGGLGTHLQPSHSEWKTPKSGTG